MKNLLLIFLLAFVACMDKSETTEGQEQFEPLSGDEAVMQTFVTVPTKRVINLDSIALASVQGDLNKFFLTRVPDSSTVVFNTNVKYDGVLLLKRRKNLILNGNGYTLSAITDGSTFPTPVNDSGDIREFWPSKRSQIAIRGGSNITIMNFKIRGANNAWDSTHGHLKDSAWENLQIPMNAYVSRFEKQHNIDAEGVKNLTITGNNLQKAYGDAIYAGRWSDFTGDWCDTVYITNNYMRFNGRQVVATVGSRNTHIENNFFDWHRRATIDLEPDDTASGCKNIWIKKNIFGPGLLLAIASGGSPALIENVTIDSNRAWHRHLNMTIGPSDSERVANKNIPLRVNWRITNNISDTISAFNSQGASGFINVWFGKDFVIENNKASVTTTTAGTMWFFSHNIDTCKLKTNRFLPTPYYYFSYPTGFKNTFVCNQKPDTVIVKPPVIDKNKISIVIPSDKVQRYKVTTHSTYPTTLYTSPDNALQIGDNTIVLTSYLRTYKSVRIYVGVSTYYYLVSKP